jgi:hypothetical protein
MYILILFTLLTLHNISAYAMYKPKNVEATKDVVATNVKSKSDALIYLSEYGYNPCENQLKPDENNEKVILCQPSIESMLQDFQTRYQLPITGKLDHKTLELMNTHRCGLKDKSLTDRFTKPW